MITAAKTIKKRVSQSCMIHAPIVVADGQFFHFFFKLRQYEVQKAACDMFLYSDSTAQESGGLLLEVML